MYVYILNKENGDSVTKEGKHMLVIDFLVCKFRDLRMTSTAEKLHFFL